MKPQYPTNHSISKHYHKIVAVYQNIFVFIPPKTKEFHLQTGGLKIMKLIDETNKNSVFWSLAS